jgi:hypothetical protein
MLDTAITTSANDEAARFLRESGFYARLEREAQEAQIGSALCSVGYYVTSVERVPARRLVIVKARRPTFQEPRPVPRIRRALLRAFRAEGFHLLPDLLSVRFGGRNVLVSAGLLEA